MAEAHVGILHFPLVCTRLGPMAFLKFSRPKSVRDLDSGLLWFKVQIGENSNRPRPIWVSAHEVLLLRCVHMSTKCVPNAISMPQAPFKRPFTPLNPGIAITHGFMGLKKLKIKHKKTLSVGPIIPITQFMQYLYRTIAHKTHRPLQL